jgi:hypothetical protein
MDMALRTVDEPEAVTEPVRPRLCRDGGAAGTLLV